PRGNGKRPRQKAHRALITPGGFLNFGLLGYSAHGLSFENQDLAKFSRQFEVFIDVIAHGRKLFGFQISATGDNKLYLLLLQSLKGGKALSFSHSNAAPELRPRRIAPIRQKEIRRTGIRLGEEIAVLWHTLLNVTRCAVYLCRFISGKIDAFAAFNRQ